MSRFPDINATDVKIPKDLESKLVLPLIEKSQQKLFFQLQSEFEETFGLWCPENQVQIVQSLLPDETLQQLQQIESSQAGPRFVSLTSERGLLIIPILSQVTAENSASLIGFSEIRSVNAKSYLKIANLVISQHRESIKSEEQKQTFAELQEQIDRLQEDNHNYLVQITADMEELTFLRQLFGFLELKTQQSDGLEKLFLTVAEQVRGSWVGFIPTLQSETSLKLPSVCFENPSSTDKQLQCDTATLRAVISEVGPQNPVTIFNGIEPSEFQSLSSQIHSLLICPVEKSGSEYGFLVAVNRVQNLDNDLSFAPTTQKSEFGSVEAGLLTSAAAMLATHFSNLELLAANKDLVTDVVRCLVTAIESKDAYTCGHSERVAQYGRRIGQELGLSDKELERLYLSGLLHDVGKIGIADSILSKPGRPRKRNSTKSKNTRMRVGKFYKESNSWSPFWTESFFTMNVWTGKDIRMVCQQTRFHWLVGSLP